MPSTLVIPCLDPTVMGLSVCGVNDMVTSPVRPSRNFAAASQAPSGAPSDNQPGWVQSFAGHGLTPPDLTDMPGG